MIMALYYDHIRCVIGHLISFILRLISSIRLHMHNSEFMMMTMMMMVVMM